MNNPHKIVIGNIATWCVECEEVNDSHLRHKDESSLHNFPTEQKINAYLYSMSVILDDLKNKKFKR